jgi:betaine-aldehyde dehydrogenase
MSTNPSLPDLASVLPQHRSAYYGGAWHEPQGGRHVEVTSPGSGRSLGTVADAGAADAAAAIAAAREGFRTWRAVPPLERAKVLKRIATIVRDHAAELALIDAADCGNPVTAMRGDADVASAQLDFFAGLVTEMKGASIPMGPDVVNFSVREPWGVVTKILPFNHPFMFCAGKIAAPLAAGNAVVVKPPEQAPLSSLRFAELIDGLLPPGVFNLVPGGREVGTVLAGHPSVAMVSLIGSVGTGRAVMRAAADTIKPVMLELGGKNALIAFADADPAEVAAAMAAGMNFTWCGQSCGSTSRAFIHDDIYEAVLQGGPGPAPVPARPADRRRDHHGRHRQQGAVRARAATSSIRPGSKARAAGDRRRPADDAALPDGFFVEPTVFADVTPRCGSRGRRSSARCSPSPAGMTRLPCSRR